jgi:lipoprotein-anchoring transpeptidase ErfK/SrfK
MDLKLIEAREHVVKAREALRRGDKNTAHDLGEKAVLLMPGLEDAWLILVASDSNPEEALAYAQKALELNPHSTRAHKAREWATKQLQKARSETSFGLTVDALSLGQLTGFGNFSGAAEPARDGRIEAPMHRPAERVVGQQRRAQVEKKSGGRPFIYGGVLVGLLMCAGIGVAVMWAAMNTSALASFLRIEKIVPTQEVLWASVDIPKLRVTPIDVSAFAPQAGAEEAANLPSAELSGLGPIETPNLAEQAASVPEATEPPGVMAMEIVPDTQYIPPAAPPVVAGGHGEGRWIDVNLSTQSAYAYDGDTVVNSFVVSTGTWLTPTVTGKFKIWIKLKSASMSGPGYYLPNVPYIMYFHKSYGLHGTYWHNNFGTPMSHGCVNLRTVDAEWLYNWASVGTVVNVHY